MAGVRPQARGVGGYQIQILWFVGAIALWIVSTVLLVVLYTDQDKLKDENQRLLDDKNRLLQQADLDAARAYYDRAAAGGQSMVGLLNRDRRALTEMLAGDASLEYPAAVKVLQDELRKIAGEKLVSSPSSFENTTALAALKSIYGEFVGQRDLAQQLSKQNEELQASNRRLTEQMAALKADFDEKSAAMEREITKLLGTDYAAFREEKEAQLADYSRAIEGLREELSAREREYGEQESAMNERAEKLLVMVERLREQLRKLSPDADPAVLLKQADGKVLDVFASAGLAYINIGAKDRLRRGMTFAVYPSDGRLPESGEGKATLEVVRVDSETAECQVRATTPGDPIIVGDLVGNVVFDRKREFRFRVIGRFDLNYDGVFDPLGGETIAAMIREWGGTVVDAVDERTDFIVMGAAPAPPASLGPDASSAEELRAKQAAAELAEFESIRGEARALSLPILNQTQFLNMIGFEYTFGLGG